MMTAGELILSALGVGTIVFAGLAFASETVEPKTVVAIVAVMAVALVEVVGASPVASANGILELAAGIGGFVGLLLGVRLVAIQNRECGKGMTA